jgi:hypothetical protein
MGLVLASHSIPLDGFIAQPNGYAGPLFGWLSSGDYKSRTFFDFSMSRESREIFDGIVDRVGETVAGRKTHEDSGRWGDELPFPWPVFILTHQPPTDADDLPFEFVTDGVAHAVVKTLRYAKRAGDRRVEGISRALCCTLTSPSLGHLAPATSQSGWSDGAFSSGGEGNTIGATTRIHANTRSTPVSTWTRRR